MDSQILSLQVLQFLKNLGADEGLLEAFEENREMLLEDLELTTEDRDFLLTTDLQQLKQMLQADEFEPSMGS